MKEAWVVDIRDQCLGANVPFFFKQWGGVFKKRNGRALQGRTWDEMPAQPPAGTPPIESRATVSPQIPNEQQL